MACECERNDVDLIISIWLSDESGISNLPKTFLGLLHVFKKTLLSDSMNNIRNLLLNQVFYLPPSFMFITKEGWPVDPIHEPLIKLSHIIAEDKSLTVCPVFEKPRVGIQSKNGVNIGFVFSELFASLDQLRTDVESQLPIFSAFSSGYLFTDKNGWPIAKSQEHKFVILYVLNNSCVTVCSERDIISRACLDCDNISERSSYIDVNDGTTLSQEQISSFSICKDLQRSRNESNPSECGSPKQILISYVRAEAAQHALQLKQALAAKRCSVFLDVHEIKTGVDWADSLNFAVTNCEVFVPLITSGYGETRWTNREVKLADTLGKFILPVSFIDGWPPKCLAIQFATTQFIPYKNTNTPTITYGDNCHSIIARDWSEENIATVAVEIMSRIRQHKQKHHKGALFVKQRSRMRSFPNFTGIDVDGLEDIQQNREGQPMVVVVLHQNDLEFGNKLKSLLEKCAFDVWCTTSIEICEGDDDISGSQSDVSPLITKSQELGFDITSSRVRFQEQANEAGVVVLVISQSFIKSKTCKQQVFYCEHRKRMVPLLLDDVSIPTWLSLLLGNNDLEYVKKPGYEERLNSRLKKAVEPCENDVFIEEQSEAKILKSVDSISRKVNRQKSVYVAGSTTFHNPLTEAICRSIGKHLVWLDGVTLVTGGFYGVGETVSWAFYEEMQHLWKNNIVLHVLPRKDVKNWINKADQKSDGTFNQVRFGRTLFTEGTVRDRENIVARTFEICILIEGGPGAAHEAEQFAWNDHTVIPVQCTGGAAAGKFGVPQKIFECPQGIDEDDWNFLSSSSAKPDEIGETLSRIVASLQNMLVSVTSQVNKQPLGVRLSQPLSKKRLQRLKTFHSFDHNKSPSSLAPLRLEHSLPASNNLAATKEIS